MDYSFRVHILKNSTSGAGHAFIELNSPTGSTYYELNSNSQFEGPHWWLLAQFSSPNGASDSDGIINKTTDIGDFLNFATAHVVSPYVAISELQFFQMVSFGDISIASTPGGSGFTDYGLFSNSCITFVDSMLKFAGVQVPLSSLFTAQDIVLTGDTWVWYSGPLSGVPRPGMPTPLDAINKFAADVGFLPPDSTPVMSVAKHDIEQLLGHQFNNTKADFDQIKMGLANGILPASIDFVSTTGNERYIATFDSTFENRFVFSGDQNGLALSTVTNGFLAQITSYPVNGTRIDQIFDWTDTQPWSQRTEYRDVNDSLTSIVTLNDPGTKTVTTYDPYSQHAWSSFVQDYNVSGNLVSTTQNNHDQTKVVEEFDPLGAQPWSLIHTVYAANGSRMQQSGDNDNGTHWTANWDLANSGSWSQVYREFDANWATATSSGWRSTAIDCNLRFYFRLDTFLSMRFHFTNGRL